MKIIKEFNRNQVIDDTLLQDCLKGKRSHWKRTFLLEDLTHGKVAFVSLNLFERIAWALENFFLHRNYSKFGTLFKTKNIKVLSPSHLEQTPKKVDGVKETIKPSEEDSKTQGEEEEKREVGKGKEIETPPSPKDESALTKIQNYLGKTQWVEAIEELEKLPLEERALQYKQYGFIAKGYLEKGDLPKALEVAKLLPIAKIACQLPFKKENLLPYHMANEINSLVAEAYIVQQNNLENAFKVVKKYPTSGNTKSDVYREYISSLIRGDKLEKARKLVGYLPSSEERRDKNTEIALAYLALDNLPEAFYMVRRYKVRRETKLEIYKAYATFLLGEGKLAAAFSVTFELSDKWERDYCDNNYCQIARGYFDLNRYKKVFHVLGRVIKKEVAAPLYKEFALSCCQNGKFAEAIQFYQKICDSRLDTTRIFFEIVDKIIEYLQTSEGEGEDYDQLLNKFLLTLKKARQFLGEDFSDFNNAVDEVVERLAHSEEEVEFVDDAGVDAD